CDDHRDLPANQLGRKFGESFHLLGPAVVDRHVLALDIAGFFEALAKSAQALCNRFGRSDLEKPNHRHRRLLRARRERPRGGCTAEKRYELAALQSITSSARASSVGGTLRPRARAVGRFIANTNLADCTTGKSAGFSPLMIRPA